MSVLDLDYYKLTMLQFIWKHYADVPVTFRLHSRKQSLADIVNPYELSNALQDYQGGWLPSGGLDYLLHAGVFESAFVADLARLLARGLPTPTITAGGDVFVSGDWFNVTLWETVVLSAVSQQYSVKNIEPPDNFKRFADIYAIGQSGAKWADFGTRRRWSRGDQEYLVASLAQQGMEHGFIGTSNIALAMGYELQPIGTYAHELEMVLRPYFGSNFGTTRNVLQKWQDMYPRNMRIALTDTYTTPDFLEQHGRFLLDNDWRGVRLDSGDPFVLGNYVDNWLVDNRPGHLEPLDVVFSDGLDAATIVKLQHDFSPDRRRAASFIQPIFGWGTGLTNPNSDLSLVMKAVESNGKQTFKITDDKEKAIR